jgi:2-polyprenyl-3-methyl-5-hydroxy-6-metoxy-1,4-benzoquinol methylase
MVSEAAAKDITPMERVKCNLCGSNDTALLFTLPDLLFNSQATSTLVRCKQCGLVYQNPRPCLSEMGNYYPDEYECYQPHIQNKKKSRLLTLLEQYGLKKRCMKIVRYQRAGRLLDIGCSIGLFLKGMEQYPGWQLSGVEISRYAAAVARQDPRLTIYDGTLDDQAFPPSSFDAVTLWDVLEHLHDPNGAVKKINQLLAPNGLIVIRVPNPESWLAKLFGRYWVGYEPPRHLFVFEKRHLAELLEKNGFEIIDTSYDIGSYMNFAFNVRMYLAGKNVRPAVRTWVEKFMYHPLSRLILGGIFYIPSLLLPGTALTVVACRNKAVSPK